MNKRLHIRGSEHEGRISYFFENSSDSMILRHSFRSLIRRWRKSRVLDQRDAASFVIVAVRAFSTFLE